MRPLVHALVERRAASGVLFALAAACSLPAQRAIAAKDCYLDCTQNCNRVAPRSVRYCETSCVDYCAQDDRRDGLSGSISSEGSEVGLLSAYDLPSRATGKQRAVPYGEDRPPALALPRDVQQALRDAVLQQGSPPR